MTIVPSPTEAVLLRLRYAGNVLVAAAEQAIRAARVDHVRDAVKVLETWTYTPQLTSRERLAVLARFVPLPSELCSVCGEHISYVNHGVDPGWWRHDDAGETWPQPHQPEPMYDFQHGNSGPGGPVFPAGGAS